MWRVLPRRSPSFGRRRVDDPTVFKTGSGQISDLIESFGHFGVSDTFKFGQIVGPNGQDSLLFEDQYQAWLAPRLPRPPRIQFYLKLAADLRKRLDETPGLTQTALAGELGISRFELIHNLNLLRLAPEIRGFLMGLPPSTREHPITKKKLKRIASIKDHTRQKQEFESLIGDNCEDTNIRNTNQVDLGS